MPNYSGLDAPFHALASETRRQVVAELARGPASVTALGEPFPMALPSFLRHVRLLEEAGCVRSIKDGRVRTCHLVPEPFDLARGWLAEQRAVWTARTGRLERFLLEEDS